MDVRSLTYFLAVAQEENITKAAEKLHTSQSNVSRQLAQLEEILDHKLFERKPRGIVLTEEGIFLKKRAQEILDLVNRTHKDFDSFDSVVRGVVPIGAAETHSMVLVADAIQSLQQKYPHIQFDLFSASTSEVLEQLNKGLIDFGILVAPIPLQNYDYLPFPIRDTFGVIFPKNHPLEKLSSIRVEDVKDYPLLIAKQQLEGNVFAAWLGETRLEELKVVSTFNLITTPALFVESGLGVAFTFDQLVMTGNSASLCFRPLAPKIEATLYLVWKKNSLFTHPSQLFLKEIKQIFSSIPFKDHKKRKP